MKQVPKEMQDKILYLMDKYKEQLIKFFGGEESKLVYCIPNAYRLIDVFKLPDGNLSISFWPNCKLYFFGRGNKYTTVAISYEKINFEYKLSHNILHKIKKIKKQAKLRDKMKQIRVKKEYDNKEKQMLMQERTID